jgi:PST family polysaccharide transporter
VCANFAIYNRHPVRFPRMVSWARIKTMLHYGSRVTIAGYVNNLQNSISSLFIGFAMGDASLGNFAKATQVREMAGQNAAAAIDRMLYPLMRSGREDPERLRHLYARGAMACMLLSAFGWAYMTGAADELVYLALGRQWVVVPALLKVLTPVMFAGPLVVAAVAVANALGKPEVWLKASIINLVAMAIGLAAGWPWGLLGMSIGLSASQAAWAFWSTRWALKETGTTLGQFTRGLLPIVLSGLLAFAAILAVRAGLAYHATGNWMGTQDIVKMPPLLLAFRLALMLTAAFGVYAWANWMLGRQFVRDILGMIKAKRSHA